LASPGFASVPDLSTWSPSVGATWNADDADSCSGSGSVKMLYVTSPFDFGNISRCVTNISANKTYYFGLRYKQNSAIYCTLEFYAANCSGAALTGTAFLSNLGSSNFWVATSTSTTSPSGAASAKVFCQTNGPGPDYIDQIYLNSVANQY
jgi:hypothetical protein